MSFFDDVNVDDIPDDPNALPNDTYKMKVTEAKIGPTQNGDKTGITFRYQIIEGSWKTFYSLTDWVRVPDGKENPEERPRMLSYLKTRLIGFGFDSDEIKSFGKETVEECVGRVFWGTTSSKKVNGNNNIRVGKFDPVSEDSPEIDFGDGENQVDF